MKCPKCGEIYDGRRGHECQGPSRDELLKLVAQLQSKVEDLTPKQETVQERQARRRERVMAAPKVTFVHKGEPGSISIVGVGTFDILPGENTLPGPVVEAWKCRQRDIAYRDMMQTYYETHSERGPMSADELDAQIEVLRNG